MSMIFDEEPKESKPTHIIRDRDTKFTAEFCSVLESDSIEFRPIPPLSPNLNPFAEAWVQRTKHEVLNHFLVFGEKHLRTILDQWLTYYHPAGPIRGSATCRLAVSLHRRFRLTTSARRTSSVTRRSVGC